MGSSLTKRQQQVYDYIEQYIDAKGFGPTVREICEAVGLSSPSTVHVHLKSLEEKGCIVRDSLKSRSIALPHKEESESIGAAAFENTLTLPLVGQVAAGEPILAEQNIEDTLTLPTELVGDSASFLLTVHGESMIEAGINDGDWIVIKQQQTARNGEIIVALIEDGATVKRFYNEGDRIRLQPENSSMEPIIVTDCAIVGKVVAVLRKVY
ncbi:MAG: transcriptional repressor LexA [Coriobacteriia bacterium]|nr:transcriptional repressor LexA [Coriobacteriia bacterium]